MKRLHDAADAPAAIGPYSQAIVSPPFVFVSGCLGFDPKTGVFVEGGIEDQAHQALQNLKSVVEASGSEVGRIVKTTVRDCKLCFRSGGVSKALNGTCRSS
jgi:enamine deaminase RidA (YjgF/YER057c/UK114 family)